MVGEQLSDARGSCRRRLHACEPVVDHRVPLEAFELLDLEAGLGEHLLPLLLGIAAHVSRVPQPLGLLDELVREDVVLDHDEVLRDTRHLGDRPANVLEVMGRDAARHDVEAPVLKRQILGARHDVGTHSRCRVDGDHRAAVLAEPSRNMASPGRDVEHLHPVARVAPLDQQIEVRSFAMRRALSEGLGPLRPDVSHAASSTARRAASSIVGSTWRFGGAASASNRRPSSAFVPSSLTTMGRSIFIWSSAARIPRATSSPRVIPPKMLKKIERTWSSLVITSRASTTPCASPPPPRSQKFAGLPPATTTTSTVDIESPAPLPRIPTLPSSLTYVTPFSRASRSCGSAASTSRISAMSAWRKRALSSTVNLESSARTSPFGVTISGLISVSIASDLTKHS